MLSGRLDARGRLTYTQAMNTAKAVHRSTDFSPYLEEARATTQLTFEQLGVPHLLDSTQFVLNNRVIRRAADARVRHMLSGKRLIITLGTKYLSLAGEDERISTYVHEAVHLVDEHFNPASWNKGTGHNQTWKDLMAKAGYPNPSITHGVDMTAFKTRYRHLCPCGYKKLIISAQRAGLIRNRTRSYLCPRCSRIIQYQNLVNVAMETL